MNDAWGAVMANVITLPREMDGHRHRIVRPRHMGDQRAGGHEVLPGGPLDGVVARMSIDREGLGLRVPLARPHEVGGRRVGPLNPRLLMWTMCN